MTELEKLIEGLKKELKVSVDSGVWYLANMKMMDSDREKLAEYLKKLLEDDFKQFQEDILAFFKKEAVCVGKRHGEPYHVCKKAVPMSVLEEEWVCKKCGDDLKPHYTGHSCAGTGEMFEIDEIKKKKEGEKE